MAANNEESLRQLRRDAEEMARSLDLGVDGAEEILLQHGSVDEYLSEADADRIQTAINARIDEAEACTASSVGEQAGPLQQLKGIAVFVVQCLADLLSPSREAVTLGPSGAAVDAVKEVPIEAIKVAVPWLNDRRLEIYHAGEADGGTRYGVRVVPYVFPTDAPRRLRVTLRAADGKSAAAVLTSRRTAKVFDVAFPPDWSELSLELCAEEQDAS